MNAKDRARFESKIDRTGSCHIWRGGRTRDGYGQIQIGGRAGKQLYAHRLAFELAFGAIPAGRIVCHTCDNPPCVNPAHLVADTYSWNARDMYRKGRQGRRAFPFGEAHHKAKLTKEQAAYVKASDESSRGLARRLGVSPNAIRLIRRGINWVSA